MSEYILFLTASNIIADGNYRINPDFHCRRSGLNWVMYVAILYSDAPCYTL